MHYLLAFLLIRISLSIHIPVNPTSETSVRELLDRLPSWISDEFQAVVISEQPELGSGEVEIMTYKEHGRLVKANSVTAALYGINYYLRNYCFTQIAWDNSSFGTGCGPSPEMIKLTSPPVRYFGNPCTFSYSLAWWTWKEWEKFIDWLALNGFNMVLTPTGQEAIWKEVFMEMGVKREELNQFFTGPAYLAWHRMGNLQGYGGGLSDSWLEGQLELNKKIVARLIELGIVPVLPTFAGFVPTALMNLFPQEKFIQNSCWNNFSEEDSCLYSVHPKSQLFENITTRFLEKQKEIYGPVTHTYSADPFMELEPSPDTKLLRDTASAIHHSCSNFDSSCVWLLQSWMFSYKKWPTKAVKTFLQAVPIGKLLILDLYADQRPLWSEFNSFYGHYFVWSMLHNFGGTTQMRGSLKRINKAYQQGLTSENTMIGGGLTMEAINQNYVVYQFMIDRMWSNDLMSIHGWLNSYVSSRYGTEDEDTLKAWNLLVQTFYAEPVDQENRFDVFIYRRPKFHQRIKYWFDASVIKTVVELMGGVRHRFDGNPLFRIDYNDIYREQLQQQLGNEVILRIYEGYGIDDRQMVTSSCIQMEKLFNEIDKHANGQYYKWEWSARSWSRSSNEEHQLTLNARDLLTTWGPQGQNRDYAHREWSGLVNNFYGVRWAFFCEWIVSNRHFNATAFDQAIFDYVERPFVLN